MIYFFQVDDKTAKIGYTTNADRRFRRWDNISPQGAKLIAVLPGDYNTEKAWHRLFEHARVPGKGREFFRLAPVLEYFQRQPQPLADQPSAPVMEFNATVEKLLRRRRVDVLKELQHILHTDSDVCDHVLRFYLNARAKAPAATNGAQRKKAPRTPQRRRTPDERAAAIAAKAASAVAIYSARKINGRAIGEIRWGELRSLVAANANNAASYLRQGTTATADAILLKKIWDHAQVDDHSRKVREVVNAQELMRLDRDAARQAPQIIERTMREYTERLAAYQPEELPNDTV
jgi:hypothetical protein